MNAAAFPFRQMFIVVLQRFLINGDWELFEQGKDYEAFLIRRK